MLLGGRLSRKMGEIMRKIIGLLSFLFAFAFAFAGPAYGQATRTWVSGVGDDVNPCSRTAPCKTFAGAISKTAAGGEINCLDPGGFGAVTITKSLTIDCSEEFGSILNSGGINGIIVNDSLSATPGQARVLIRGVHINGAGTTLGLNGIRFISGASLIVEDVTIQNQSGAGMSIQPQQVSRFYIANTTISNIGTTSAGRGILIQPTGAGGNARVEIVNTRLFDNQFEGIRVDSTGNTNTNPIRVDINNTEVSNAATGIVGASNAGLSFVRIHIANSSINNNTTALHSFGIGTTMMIGASTITNNTTPTQITSSGVLQSYGDNRAQGNTNPPAFTAPTLPSS